MFRSILIAIICAVSSISAFAKTSQVSYLLQISSNLQCQSLAIELISQADETVSYLRFKQSAFATVEVTEGTYTFGQVICTTEDGRESFDVLIGAIAPFSLSADKAYYGGRLIFEDVAKVAANDAPDVLSNCTRLISKARGIKSDECRDGVGVETNAQATRQIRVYAPEITADELKTVRDALSATEDQLVYLPLGV